MSVPGLLHVALMAAALALGAALLARPKGDAGHRRLGRVFVAAMVVSNLAVLAIYRDAGRPGVFHLLALVSLLSLAAAVILVRRRGRGPRVAHGHVMLWTYGGVVAAGLGQGATALGLSPWPAILATSAAVGLVAARADFEGMLRRRR